MNYKLLLQYDGTRYDGWQKQGNTANTIQGRLEAVLSALAGVTAALGCSGPWLRGAVFLVVSGALFCASGALRGEDLRWARGLVARRR